MRSVAWRRSDVAMGRRTVLGLLLVAGCSARPASGTSHSGQGTSAPTAVQTFLTSMQDVGGVRLAVSPSLQPVPARPGSAWPFALAEPGAGTRLAVGNPLATADLNLAAQALWGLVASEVQDCAAQSLLALEGGKVYRLSFTWGSPAGPAEGSAWVLQVQQQVVPVLLLSDDQAELAALEASLLEAAK